MILLVRFKEVAFFLTLRFRASIYQNRLNLAVSMSSTFALQRKISQNWHIQRKLIVMADKIIYGVINIMRYRSQVITDKQIKTHVLFHLDSVPCA